MRRVGFTTIEMIIVVVMIGIIAVIGFPKIRRALDSTNVRSTRVFVGTAVATARAAAVQRGCRAVVHFSRRADTVWGTRCSRATPAATRTSGGRGDRRGPHRRQPAGRRLHRAQRRVGGGVAGSRAGGLAQLALCGRHDQSLAPGAVVQIPDAAEPMAPRQHGDLHLMSSLARRGFTMIELLIALVILGIVSAALYKVLVTNQRTYLAQTQRIDLQHNNRAAATILPAALRG